MAPVIPSYRTRLLQPKLESGVEPESEASLLAQEGLMSSKKRHGLVLDLPGAPPFPHTVPVVGPYLFSDEPVEVGDDHPISLAAARKLDKDPGCPLKLVDIPDKAAARGEKED